MAGHFNRSNLKNYSTNHITICSCFAPFKFAIGVKQPIGLIEFCSLQVRRQLLGYLVELHVLDVSELLKRPDDP